ncbi:AraC family transcriptional regulator [Cohnella zeiphila]|uniref:AraC family transcriptional regulator n=1 Tax=Cohnella zeiphila TaxID=2761120 RepID=A0A7X0VW22_9BACL|nr:AraC family transcriptional regulator [Cohnella zeiphila]MBB6730493.1 AraC family transcriptional regulator [Cohnella zeiphila]
MDAGQLRENRRHGSPGFPVGAYIMENQTGQPLLESHWHEEAEFLLLLAGQARVRVGLAEIELGAGEAVFVPGGELHGADGIHDSSCSYAAVVFDLEWLADAGDSFSSRFLQPLGRRKIGLSPVASGGTEWGANVVLRLKKLASLYESDDPAKEMRVKGELLLLLADYWTAGQWTERQSAPPGEAMALERLKGALLYIETHFARKLTVRELAEAAGMSEGHFSRTFKTFMRKTPVEYVNQYRLRRAARLLEGSGLTVGEAASASGFDNFSYFSKTFRALFGCSPSDYRKRASFRQEEI